jgi:hypothetical protein
MPSLPPTVLPELRALWMRALGARMAAQAADQQAQLLGKEYESTLGACLKMLDLDERVTWRVNLDTGELEATEAGEVPTTTGVVPNGQGIVLNR